MAEEIADRRTDFLTARQLAEHLQVSESTIHRLRRSGRIPAVQITDRLARFNLKDVRRALARAASNASAQEADAADDRQLGFSDVFAGFDGDGA